MKPSPVLQCLVGIPLVREIGRQLPYNFRVEDDARAVSATRLGKDGIHLEVQDTSETSRFIDISKEGTMTTTIIGGGERSEPTSQKLFNETTVARAYAFIVGNEKACKSK